MSRSATVLDNGRGSPRPDASFTLAFGADGAADGPGSKRAKRPLPHIDDVTSVTVDLDRSTPLDKVLATAESLMRQAESSRNFGRPDLALKDYIKATLIVVDVVPRNTGWPSLQADNKAQRERYRRLFHQINASHAAFEGLKADIKADNARSGVLPRGTPGRSMPVQEKIKPVVHPKPPSLRGNAIRPGNAPTSIPSSPPTSSPSSPTSVQDLAQRFAKLRSNAAAALPASRIHTQTALPDLPKMPDAIYSPARGTVSSEAAELPSSTPRDDEKQPQQPAPTKRARPTIPDGHTVAARDLVELMRRGSKDLSILLVDIRGRDEFDDGHIMSQASICVEPEVLTRDNISANEVADSMVLAPSAEQVHFEMRHEFDLVVFYDQSSTHISWTPESPAQKAILGLYNALGHYDFVGESGAKKPKLLEGGLDAWTSLMGAVSLQTSTTTTPAAKPRRAPLFRPRPRQKYVTKPIQDADEARRWEESLNNLDAFSPVRTTDDFLRRFPSVSTLQESMVADGSREKRMLAHTAVPPARHQDLFSTWPSPPQRPAPTVPRPSYSGLAGADDRDELVRALQTRPKDERRKQKKPVGLVNPGNWCYGNSSLQSLFGTTGFADLLMTGDWQQQYQVPMKADEKIQHPQLLAKMLGNLFYWMDRGAFDAMEAKTLMEYIRHIHQKTVDGSIKDDNETFGGASQQDAQEYFSFIIDQLHDETNRFRDRSAPLVAAVDNDPRSLLHNSIKYWQAYRAVNDSIVDRYWRGLNVQTSACPQCGDHTMSFQISDITVLGVPPAHGNLRDMLAEHTAVDYPAGYTCQRCSQPGRGRRLVFARLPDRLAFTFQRFQATGLSAGLTKIGSRVEFPALDLDMGPYCIDAKDRAVDAEDDAEAAVAAAGGDRQFCGPFLYDCYAVICHSGSMLSSGHYISYVRDQTSEDPTDWIRFDDATVTRIKVGTGQKDDQLDKMYKWRNQQAYMVFYKRKGT